ncbi:hypothetical protein E2C01_057530 [Portunus trituberculatus]|uniref:Uncharacterized protein n=1 Tax=Portunus trituberculatus TaxID=210409 RepID=A0A5B7GX24_PORTR|nr:hypothetical protein [Portunus trituberculatus]
MAPGRKVFVLEEGRESEKLGLDTDEFVRRRLYRGVTSWSSLRVVVVVVVVVVWCPARRWERSRCGGINASH